MSTHPSRFPGTTNDPQKHVLTKKQAERLSAIAALPTEKLAGKTAVELEKALRFVIDPKILLFRRICGQVVKTDANGNELPVPFATVTVYDTDFGLLGWSPLGSQYSWFFPFNARREVLATVTTDECGRFCVWIPRFDVDHYLRWRLERRCYLTWLRKPTIVDLLRDHEVVPPPGPDPDPRPVVVDEHLLTHAARVLDDRALSRLRTLAAPARIGAKVVETNEVLEAPAFVGRVAAPFDAAARKALAGGIGERLAKRIGVAPDVLTKLDLSRFYGPFIKCRWVITPQWSTVLDVPDLTFEVTQDVNGDGQQEVIYSEGLFDVRWDAGNIADVKLQASAIAISNPNCNIPDIGPCGAPAILFASSYPLAVPGTTTIPPVPPHHDATTGYALQPNRPDDNGIPGEGVRGDPANAPFAGAFMLVGCAEKPNATHYRVEHQIDGGPVGYLSGGYGPLAKVNPVTNVLETLSVSPVDGQWYPIIRRADGWNPVGIIAPMSEPGNHNHAVRLEFGNLAGGTITPVANSFTPLIHLVIDGTPPQIETPVLQWRHPDVSLGWNSLNLGNCPVVVRNATRRVQFRLFFRVSANHLRDFSVAASGCGPVTPQLITDGRDGLSLPAADARAHWYTSPGDNAHVRELFYELPADAPAGCYHFSIFAASRAFLPTEVLTGAPPDWKIDRNPVYVQPSYAVSVQ